MKITRTLLLYGFVGLAIEAVGIAAWLLGWERLGRAFFQVPATMLPNAIPAIRQGEVSDAVVFWLGCMSGAVLWGIALFLVVSAISWSHERINRSRHGRTVN